MERSVSGVGVLDKAVAILDALDAGPMPFADLVAGSGLSRATAHRLALALERHGLIVRDGEGRFSLGPRMAAHSFVPAVLPALQALRDETGESAQLYVRRATTRLCVASIESAAGLRTIVPVGAVLPLAAGSAGKILRGDSSALKRGWAQSVEERERGVASVSAPVRRAGEVVAAVSVSGPLDRTSRSPGRRYSAAVVAAARCVEEAMGWD